MKKQFIIYALALCALFGCKDNSGLYGLLTDYDARITTLERLCTELNTNISSLQTIVEAQQAGDYITSITPIKENGVVIGYTITFAKNDPITIYHGQNGKDGKDGTNGINGTNGVDGHTPIIGVAKDTDGVYYWTLDGEWLLDNNGQKLRVSGKDGKDGIDGQNGQDGTNGTNGTNGTDGTNGTNGADGQDGISPQLKIEADYWWISYDNGATWTQLGKAKGDKGDPGNDGTNGTDGQDGQDGDSMFQSVTQDEDNVYFTLTGGTIITIAKNNTSSSPDGYNVTGKKNGYQYVDLGLPSGTMWATCNVGSNYPAGMGYKYAWGEVAYKSSYNQSNYTLTYTSLPTCISGTENDVATQILGAPWSMPTQAQMQELVEYATFSETTLNDVGGFRVTGVNGNCIFLPFEIPSQKLFRYISGDKYNNNYIYCLSISQQYKNSEYHVAGNVGVAFCSTYTNVSTSYSFTNYFYYYLGYCVRPVFTP